jgi:DNA-binding transcriptional LysR family regulator
MADLNELSIFVRVAQLGSFSAAAHALGMSVSSVSRKVAELEARLGLSLIKRTTRKLNLSEHGLSFFERCAPLLAGLEEAEAGVTAARLEPEGVLHVTAPAALGRGEFIDFISGFLSRYPKLRIELAITNQYLDFVATEVDVAIRFGELADSGVIAKRLGLSQRVLVAAPEYLKRCGKPRLPADLERHDCVLFKSKSDGAEWTLQSNRQRARVGVRGRVTANNLEAVNELAVRGHGIALLPEPYLVAGSALGTLEHVLLAWTSAPIPVHAVYLNRKFVPAKVQTFLTELASWKNSTWRPARAR